MRVAKRVGIAVTYDVMTRTAAGLWRRVGLAAGVCVALLLTLVGTASAAPAPVLAVKWFDYPTHIASGHSGIILLSVTNSTEVASNGTVTVTDTLPSGVTATSAGDGFSWDCSGTTVITCVNDPANNPSIGLGQGYGEIRMEVQVDPGASGTLTEQITVAGGGTTRDTSLTRPFEVSSSDPGFGIVPGSFTANAVNRDGSDATQAAGHPFAATTEFAFNSKEGVSAYTGEPAAYVDERIKDVIVDLPVGFVGNPTAAPTCTTAELGKTVLGLGSCPASTQVGIVSPALNGGGGGPPYGVEGTVPVFNMVPSRGQAAAFGFVVAGVPITLSAKTRPGDNGIEVTVPDISEAFEIYSQRLTLWGVPADASHDHERSCEGFTSGCSYSLTTPKRAFLRNPTGCVGPQTTALRVDSWQQPGVFKDYSYTTATGTSGCENAPFQPSMDIHPDTTQAGAPAGLNVDLSLPQSESTTGLGTADLRRAVVTLPVGMSINPSAADGLAGCASASIGIGTNTPVSCPPASKIGEVQIATPLLAEELKGSVFLGQPEPGNTYRVFIDAESSERGVAIRLEGVLTLDPVTGRLTTVFDGNPQLPFSDLKLRLKGGPRAALSNPIGCGTATSSYELTSWSGRTVTGSSSFDVSADGAGAACPPVQPFSPAFSAGTTNPQAGAFSPFTLSFSRSDTDQTLSGLKLQMPAGLLGTIKSVLQCPEPQASQGACGAGSLIGHTTVGAGAGSSPFYLGGQVYLTGPYKGAPFGLSIVVPAIAGPYNLGTVVVRAQIAVDPHTAQVTVTSDPLPTILQGIPLNLRTVNVLVDRVGFMFNPTSCTPLSVGATISSVQGATAATSNRFQAANCASLAFKPKLTALTQAKHSKAGGESLHVKVTSGAGQANIGKVRVLLPKALPSRLTTLQKACLQATFDANPASCPAASLVGTATAVTPVLAHPLTGPAYLVSHGGAAFPDLVVVLQGEGITLYLDGNTDIKHGITSSTFNSVPDAPISTFDLVLPQGPHSALAANGNLCKIPLSMPTTITGQNGAQVKQTTWIAVSGCPKSKKKQPTRHVKAKARRGGHS
jgi:hypothetical protein